MLSGGWKASCTQEEVCVNRRQRNMVWATLMETRGGGRKAKLTKETGIM